MSGIYEYRRPGRRPAAFLGIGAAGGFFAITALGAVSASTLAVCGAMGAGWVWAIRTAPVSGCRIDDTQLTWFKSGRKTQLALHDIDRIELDPAAQRARTCRIVLTDGTTMRLPALCLPPSETFASVLARRGIAIAGR